jgi:predicted nucleotidyltransferase
VLHMAVNVGNVDFVKYILRKCPDLLSQKACNKNVLEIAQCIKKMRN